MRNIILAVAVPLLFCGCGRNVGCGGPRGASDESELDAVLPAEIKLPEAVGAQTLDKTPEYLIYLNANEQGQVLLAPSNVYRDADGLVSTLDNPIQVENFLRRRALEDRDATGDRYTEKPPRSMIVLRVHKDCSFEKTYAILTAARKAGFDKYQWRARRGLEGEGQIPFTLAEPEKKPDVEFTARVTATDEGKIEKIALRGDGIDKELDLKTDVADFEKKLKELATKYKGKRIKLTLELGDKLL